MFTKHGSISLAPVLAFADATLATGEGNGVVVENAISGPTVLPLPNRNT
jgi:hypothetical protein